MSPLATSLIAIPDEDAEFEIFSPGLCFLSGRLVVSNDGTTSTVYYSGPESQHLIHISFIQPHVFVNSVNLESHGLMVQEHYDRNTLSTTITLRHIDYNNSAHEYEEFEIEYICTTGILPHPYTENLGVGVPIQIRGKIVGRHEISSKWIVFVRSQDLDATQILAFNHDLLLVHGAG
ncbi:hypothetical protein DFH28DRAFT_929818 [Melampsora americana]|nr:hypothetical protein DFH28DRAFT_929818 [Melampsora americana]